MIQGQQDGCAPRSNRPIGPDGVGTTQWCSVPKRFHGPRLGPGLGLVVVSMSEAHGTD